MDQILKAHKLGSATARKKKIEEREVAMRLNEERRTRVLLYGYSSEDDESSDGGETYSPVPDTHPTRPVPVPTYSLVQPDIRPSRPMPVPAYSLIPDTHPITVSAYSAVEDNRPNLPLPVSIYSTSNNNPSTNTPNAPTERIQSIPYPCRSTLPAKLQIPEIIVPKPLSPHFLSFHADSLPRVDDGDDEVDLLGPETPIEVATPILYSIPLARPSMIFISTSSPQINGKGPHRPISLPHAPPIPPRSDKRISATSLRSTNSSIGTPIITVSSASSTGADVSKRAEKSIRRRPVTISGRTESAFQSQAPVYDVFPRRPKTNSPNQRDQLVIHEEPPHYASPPAPQAAADTNTRRSSSYPIVHKDESPMANPSSPQLRGKKSSSTLRQRRSSIGLALRNVSSSFRSKTNSSPDTSGSVGPGEYGDCIDISAFPMPPPASPLFRQSFHQAESRTKVVPSAASRMSRVRTTIRL